MENKTLVSLVSEQTIPNIELIKEFAQSITKYVFITTKQMNKQLQWIINATDLNKDIFDIIEVNPFDTEDIENRINAYNFGDDDLMLNITGGTKLMSLVVSELFKNLLAKSYYVTGKDKTYIKVFPNRGERIFKLKHNLSLKEYLTGYGFEFEETKTLHDIKTAENIFNKYINLSTDEQKSLFEPVRIRRGRNMDIEKNSPLYIFLKEAGYPFENKLNKKDTKYLSGDWLEEYIYFKLKEELKLNDKEIATGLNLKKENTPNEIDVIFIYDHKLYIIECKTSIIALQTIKRIRNGVEVEEQKEIKLLPEIIYKSDALRNKFGLFAKTYILTLEEIKTEAGEPIEGYQTHFDRAELSRINIISKRDLTSSKQIRELLNI